MANRYCNLVGSKKISEDFNNINIGFDAVQKDMDSKSSGNHRHPNATDTTDGFMSAQDKAKMDASTAAATPGTLVQRDASGRMKAAAPSAKTDVARKAEVDAVQSDLDSHKADAVMHVTEADHEKLGSIEDGAEVNQPAFSRVNDIEAGEKTDALTFKGGVGIKITTNPNSKEVTITASGESTPGAHGSSHTEHGSDPIPYATAKEGGLMSSADKAEFDKLATEVPKQASELMQHDKKLKEHTTELEDHDQRIEAVESGLADVPDKPLELPPGLQIVESEQDTPFQMGEVKGRTLINLPGSEGNFDYRTSPLFTFFGTGEIIPASTPVGTKVQKIVCNRAADSPGHFGARYELNIDRSKHYVAVVYLDNISCDEPVYFSFAEWKSTGYSTIRKSGNVKKGDGMQYRYIDISPDRLETQEKLVFYFRGEGTAGAEFRIGAFGLYEISQTEYEAIGKMKFAQVAEKYPYVDSMTNVKNPYAIVTGGNLLPSFYHMGAVNGAIVDIQSAYEIDLMTNSTLQFVGKGNMEAKHKTYRIDFDSMGTDVKCYFNEQAAIDAIPIRQHEIGSGATIEIGDDTKYIGVFFGNMSATGSFKVKNPMLVPGTDPKPFVPQQRSMLAFETELAAHPVDGSNPDTLFMGDDGLPYVLEPWGKVDLTQTKPWGTDPNVEPGAKLVYYRDGSINGIDFNVYATKFDGKMLKTSQAAGIQEVDSVLLYKNGLHITVANTDSGWGQDYNPEPEEIKAYFLGWRIGWWNNETQKLDPWDGTQPIDQKRWVNILTNGDMQTSLPTEMAKNYTPYRLQYLKAKPTVEPVRNYGLGATLTAGSNMIEVGSGIVIRERANPVRTSANDILINSSVPGEDASRLRNKTDKILAIHRNNSVDSSWIRQVVSQAYGKERAIWYGGAGFDPTAVYHVTYTMLDPMLAAPISGTVAANLRGAISDLVQDVGDVQRRLSVSEVRLNSITSGLNAPLEWITATLLNGWKSVPGRPVQYAKDAFGFVHFRGTLDSSEAAKAVGTDIFVLPIQYRPSRVIGVPTVTYSSPQDIQPYAVDIGNGGSIRITMENTRRFIYLESFSFYVGGEKV